MKKNLVLMFILSIGLMPSIAIGASLCCQLSSGVQESLAGVAVPGEDELSLQFNYSLSRMDEFRQGSAARSLDEARAYAKPNGSSYTSVPVTMDMVKYTMTAGYGFNARLKAFVSVPYLRNTMEMTVSQGVMMGWMGMTMQPVSGVGDVTAMALYRIYTGNSLQQPGSAFTVGLGLKTATGSSTERTSSGKLVHAHMQPGTGSWDPLLSLLYTTMLDEVQLQADATYQYSTRNRQGYEFGDSLAAGLAARYYVLQEISVSAALTYLTVGMASDRDGRYYDPVENSSLMDDPANTGGDSTWFSPGVQVFPAENLSLDAKFQVPIYENVNGIQLVSRYRVLFGLAYAFQ